MAPEPEDDKAHHFDAVQDTGEAYTQFHGWILRCLWCEVKATGKTKREALERLRAHYDKFNITIH